MPKRMVDSDLWKTKWFRRLPPDGKVLWLYLNAACDIAGFIEWDEEEAIFRTGLTPKRVNDAMAEIQGRVIEKDGTSWMWLPTFIYEQANWPLNEANAVHRGILRLLDERQAFDRRVLMLLEGEDIRGTFSQLGPLFDDSEEAPKKPLPRGYSNSSSSSNSSSKRRMSRAEMKALATRCLEYMNDQLGREKAEQFRSWAGMLERIMEGATEEDIKLVIDHRIFEWGKNAEMKKYLRPDTLFRPTKFPMYVTEAKAWDAGGRVKVWKGKGATAREQTYDDLMEDCQ